MIVFFLPNGIGDTLMALPALRRLIDVKGVSGVCVVVSSGIHTFLLKRFVNLGLRTLERYDGRGFAQLRLWLRLFRLRADWIVAPMLSRKPFHKLYFAALLTKILVPSSFMKCQSWRLRTSTLSLANFTGHQTNFFVQFLAEVVPGIARQRVHFDELAPLGQPINLMRELHPPVARVAVGISCGELERHKIPRPAYFARLLNAISVQRPIELLVMGSLSDQPLIDEMCSHLRPGFDIEVLIAAPIDLVIARMAECNLGIAGTTGQGHMMAAAGLPMLVLAGVTNSQESGPYVERASVLRHRYACGPCYQEKYPLGCRQVDCMDTLDVNNGASLARKLIDDGEFGLGWMTDKPKQKTISVDVIKSLHERPSTEWISHKDSQP